MASWTIPSCHINAAKTARKLSAKQDGKARFGNVAVLFVMSFISHEDILGKLSLANEFLVSFSLSAGLENRLSVGVTGRWKKLGCELGDQSGKEFVAKFPVVGENFSPGND